MAARALWKGTLRLSLIQIPIRVFAATDSESGVSFRQLHRKCHTPIQYKKWCPHCDEEVTKDEIVKGYEKSKGHFVVVEEEEIKSARPEVTHTINVAQVVPNSVIDPLSVEKPYYVAPDGKQAGAAFAVMRDSLEGRAAVGKLALYGRDYLVAVVPRESALVMFMLRHTSEVRSLDSIDELKFAETKVKPEEVRLAKQVLSSFETNEDLSHYTDEYREALQKIVDAKAAEQEVIAPAAKGRKAPEVVNLMDALRESLARVSSEKKRPARAGVRSAGKVIRHPASKKTRKAS